MKTGIVLAVGFISLIAAAVASAQPMAIRVKIDFPFLAEGRMFPAGTYDLKRDESASVFRITDEGRNAGVAQVLTRLTAEQHAMKGASAHLVFDKAGETYTLSEVWIPGQDGYVLALTKGAHGHKVVSVMR